MGSSQRMFHSVARSPPWATVERSQACRRVSRSQDQPRSRPVRSCRAPCLLVAAVRSEEQTSELQSLMRTSYAVFCLKKKNQTTTIQTKTSVYVQAMKLNMNTQRL